MRAPIGLRDAHRLTDNDDPDFYPTPPWAARAVAEFVRELDGAAESVWEPACGAGHLAHGLKDYFATVYASDAYSYGGHAVLDFLAPGAATLPDADWIFTNPPFSLVDPFVRLAWKRARRGVAFIGRAALMESIGRHELLRHACPLTIFAPFSERVPMHKGRWEPEGTTAAFYAALIWLKPVMKPRRHMARIGEEYWPATRWIAPGAERRLTHEDDARLFGVRERGAA